MKAIISDLEALLFDPEHVGTSCGFLVVKKNKNSVSPYRTLFLTRRVHSTIENQALYVHAVSY